MCVKTEADVKLDCAKQDIQGALLALSDITIERCAGWDDFRFEYQAKIAEAFNLIRQARDLLC